MHAFEEDEAPPPRHTALTVWGVCVAILLVPSLLAWSVRFMALGMQCAPGPQLCQGIGLGGGLRDTLGLCWLIGTDTLLSIVIALAASIAALCDRRPLLAALSLLLLPIAALVLPTLAVYISTYDGCEVNEAGVGTCMLWGASMGMSFHHAASVPWLLYGFVPYSFALSLIVGAVGFLFFRPKNQA